jgi:hypothetical protein
MTRRTASMLTGMTLLGLAIAAFPQAGFAQSNLEDGIWQLNLAKSKYSPGPPPKSATGYIQGEGQNRKATVVGIDAAGNPTTEVYTRIEDGQPHPSTGSPVFDASAYTRVDAYTVNVTRTKAGKVVVTGTIVVSRDGKTLTQTSTGTDANGRQFTNIQVLDKQ